MKHEWRKHEKELYAPKQTPEIVDIPPLKYFTVSGEGNPNSDSFKAAIEKLYSASYNVRMSHKKGEQPEGYFEYTVYPLEGFWSLTEEGILDYQKHGVINKDYLSFKIMIRQPEFVSEAYANALIKSLDLEDSLKFEVIEEGLNLQILHLGSYDDEPATFKIMETYCQEHQLERLTHDHKEVYLSDARRVSPDKNRTILRFPIKKR